MPKLEYSERFAADLAQVTSAKVEKRVLAALDSIEAFGGYGSRNVPDSIRRSFGDGIRKVVVDPFDLVYTYYPDEDLIHIHALVHRKAAK